MKPCPVHLEISQTWQGSPVPKADTIRLELGVSGAHLTIDVDAPFYGDPRPSGPPGPTDGLWNYEVVEIFIAGVGPEYLEIELGPHGHHLVLQLADADDALFDPLPLPSHVDDWAPQGLEHWSNPLPDALRVCRPAVYDR